MKDPIAGVSKDISDAMNLCGATALTEDNLLLRKCEHGTWHPVGHLNRNLHDKDWETRHQAFSEIQPAFIKMAQCCGCCDEWEQHAPKPIMLPTDARAVERDHWNQNFANR